MTFVPSDLLSILSLIFLEGLLSADNALVIALLVRDLEYKQQQRALWIGLALAFGLRSIGIGLASFLITLWWVCGLGGIYLIFLTLKHFRSKHIGDSDASTTTGITKKTASFSFIIVQIAVTDLFFAIDSILVAVALVPGKEKLWIVYLGGFLGMLLLRFTAQILIGVVQKYPSLDNVAYLLVGWAGIKLGFEALHLYGLGHQKSYPSLPESIFWPVFALLVTFGAIHAIRKGPATGPSIDETEMISDGDADITLHGAERHVPDEI